jgi:hypothetical protein
MGQTQWLASGPPESGWQTTLTLASNSAAPSPRLIVLTGDESLESKASDSASGTRPSPPSLTAASAPESPRSFGSTEPSVDPQPLDANDNPTTTMA